MGVFSRENPGKLQLLERVRLSGIRSAKDIYRLIFTAKDVDYSPGDSLGIFPKNDHVEVEQILQLLHFNGDEQIDLKGEYITIRDALKEKYCITHLPKRFLIFFRENLDETQCKLFDEHFFYANEDRYSLYELLSTFNTVHISPNELCKLLKKTAPRFYSIASAKSLQKEKLHLIVNTVSYTSALGNVRYGVVSSFINNRLKIGECVDAYVVNSSFKLPRDESRDVIMIGPGTGLAPFMSFLYDTEARKQAGKTIGRSWLFFGDQHEATDFLEHDELKRLLDARILTRLELAFSRDQEEKIYVQDRMWESRDELWDWLINGASFYICGNANRMAVDVEHMLKKIAMFCGCLDENEATNWLIDLKSQGRYQKDVY